MKILEKSLDDANNLNYYKGIRNILDVIYNYIAESMQIKTTIFIEHLEKTKKCTEYNKNKLITGKLQNRHVFWII